MYSLQMTNGYLWQPRASAKYKYLRMLYILTYIQMGALICLPIAFKQMNKFNAWYVMNILIYILSTIYTNLCIIKAK